ncbi:hypothetical protein M513_05589 [Trichuris suis]|uniref:Immunoglobulin I-set domain protein n=1 Tax=Trichuris suis TaxID=68888 RepID=A0A085M8D7_9BILA|nr:hypothetical protein M513_05589 [Trichuris suis]
MYIRSDERTHIIGAFGNGNKFVLEFSFTVVVRRGKLLFFRVAITFRVLFVSAYSRMEVQTFLHRPWTLSQDEIVKLVRKVSRQQVINAIELTAEKEPIQMPKLCTLIFRGFASANISYQVFKETLVYMVRRWTLGQFHESVESSVVTVLLSEIHRLNPTDAMAVTVNLIELIDNDLKGNRLVHLLPKLLQCLSRAQNVETSERILKGWEAADFIVGKIVRIPSTSIAALLLLALWKELDLSDTEKDKLFESLMDCMAELNLEDIPNFVLKLLSIFALEANAKYVGRLLEFFCSLTTRARHLVNGMSAIRNAQCNVILHMMHTIRTHQNFGKTLLNDFKSMKDIASSNFYLPCLLCISRLNRLRRKAQALVKSSVTECVRKKLNVQSSKWLRSVVECSDLQKTMDSLISYESDSWEYVIEGLCELGFTLLEVYPGRSLALRGSLHYELFSLGKYLITECFKHHHFIRRGVVERIMDAIMLQSLACDQLLRLFTTLVKIAPMTVIENRARLTDAFEVLPLLPLNCSLRFVKALIAIIDIKPEIRFALFKSLRNAVFSKTAVKPVETLGSFDSFIALVPVRDFSSLCFHYRLSSDTQRGICKRVKQALAVFCYFLAKRMSSTHSALARCPARLSLFRHSPAKHQSIFGTSTKKSYLCVETMFLEMVACFQKALRLQVELRRTLYTGLAKAASDHPAIREPVLDLLFRQLEQYLPDEKSNRLSIFNLEACATTAKDGAHLLEPVGTLISAITSLARENVADESDSYCQHAVDFVLIDKVKCCLGSLASHVADSQLEDFNLDKSVSYSHEEMAGQKNTLLGYQFLSMVEALVEFFILNFDDRKETADNMLKLCSLWSKMEELLRERLGWRAQKRKLLAAESQRDVSRLRTTNDGSVRCCVSISAIVSLLSLMFGKAEPANEAVISLLQNDEHFVGWLFALAQRRLTALDMELSRRKTFEDICVLARLTLSYFQCGFSTRVEMRQASPALGYKALEVFASCMDANRLHYSDQFEKSLSFLVEQFELSPSAWEQMESTSRFYHLSVTFLKLLVRNLTNAPSSSEIEKPEKVSELLMHMIEIFISHIPPESSFYSQVFNSLLEICQQQCIVDAAVVRRLYKMTLDMQKQIDVIPTCVVSLAEQLHITFGDITDGDLLGSSAEFFFASVIPKTAPVVLQALFAQLESLLEDGIFALSEAKSIRLSTLSDVAGKEHAETRAGDIERGVCDIFCLVLLVWHELAQSRIPLKLIDNTVKGLEKMYKALTVLSKHYLTMCSKKLMAVPEDSFQKLTKKSGTNVTCYVYKLISYAQVEERNSNVFRLNSAKAKARTIREMKCLSNLIFAIETYEESLIQLSAKCNMNFMAGIKPSVNRDFRIDVNRIRAAFQRQNDDTVQRWFGLCGMSGMVSFLLLLFGAHWICCSGAQLELVPKTLLNRKTGDSFVVQCRLRDATSNVLNRPRWFHSTSAGADQPVPGSGRVRMKEVDPQWTNLVFSPAERSDEGVYKCTAQVGEQTLSQRIELHLYEKIQMEDTPAVQHPHDGEDARIVCHVRADPPASIMWLRNDDVIVEGGERGYRLYNDSSTLYIPHFSSESDNGVYRCQAIQQETGDFQSIDISVDAYVKPRVDFFSPSVEVNEDDDAAMSCTATGNPPPEVFWFKNDFRISNDSKYMTEETGSLLIRQVNADDIGSYECRATNLLGSVSRSIDLSVFLKPQLEMLRDMEAKKGDSISVSCKFSGGDPMHIVWKSKGITLDPEPSENDVSVTSPLPERYSVTKSGDIVALHIESLQMDDAGMYECMASNQAGSSSVSFNLRVTYPPEMTEKEMLSLRAVNGQTVVMSCQVSAVPEPTWTWLSPGGDELSSDATKYFIETSSSNLNSSLRVVISNAHDYGHYACKADNKVGDPAIRLIDVFEVHIPPKPELIFENQHPNYASILIPNYAGIQSSSQPLQIVFEVAKESDFMSGDFNWEEGDVAQTVLDYDSSSSYTVKGLVPLTKYVLRVHSKNEAGMSEYAEAPYETVRPRIPEAPTFKPFAEGNHCSPINCLVSWDEPNDGGSDILGYDIEYQSVGALSDGSSMSVDEGKWIPVGPISASEQYVVLRHLEPVTAYMIRARARNDQGESNWGQTFFETTSESWSSSGSVGTGAIVAIVIFIFLIIFIIVDVTCYYVNQCGVLMCLCVNCCGKVSPQVKAKEIAMEEGQIATDEKKPLKDSLQSQDERNDVNDDSTKMLSSGKDKSEKKNTVV